jgi:hypothetical protein
MTMSQDMHNRPAVTDAISMIAPDFSDAAKRVKVRDSAKGMWSWSGIFGGG